MTENQALAVDAVVGILLTWGAFIAVGALGASDTVQAVVGMIGLCVTCFLVGVIDVHYTRKAIERGEPPDDLN